jgi:lipopolysaccharide/colanic/teichoic acid biosynthesis glycosyltransferase
MRDLYSDIPFGFQLDSGFVEKDFVLTEMLEQEEDIANYIESIAYLHQKSPHIIQLFNFDQKTINSLKKTQNKTLIYNQTINKISNIHLFLNTFSGVLKSGDLLAINFQSSHQVKETYFTNSFKLIDNIRYITNRLHHYLTYKLFQNNTKNIHGISSKHRHLSYVEAVGTSFACGYELFSKKIINNKYYIILKKNEKKPVPEKKYRTIIKLPRIGKNGKRINVYKFRTMFPYSEYLQEYIHKKNKLDKGGKFKNDYRITKAGKFMRKFWIDELPMIFNLLKSDIKLVGVRPLSEHYLNLYDKELIKKRLKTKPGLLPPYYADMPKGLKEIQESELNYLNCYFKTPILTDIKYFFKICYNILFKKQRSK